MTTRAQLMEELFELGVFPKTQVRPEVEQQIADSMAGRWCVLTMTSGQELQQAVRDKLFVLLEEHEVPTQLCFGGARFVFPQGPERCEINRILKRVAT